MVSLPQAVQPEVLWEVEGRSGGRNKPGHSSLTHSLALSLIHSFTHSPFPSFVQQIFIIQISSVQSLSRV